MKAMCEMSTGYTLECSQYLYQKRKHSTVHNSSKMGTTPMTFSNAMCTQQCIHILGYYAAAKGGQREAVARTCSVEDARTALTGV